MKIREFTIIPEDKDKPMKMIYEDDTGAVKTYDCTIEEDSFKLIKKCLDQGVLPPLNIEPKSTKGIHVHKNGWT